MWFGMVSEVGPRKYVLDRGVHWRHLASTIEPSMCGGDAPFCQIILSTCRLCFFADSICDGRKWGRRGPVWRRCRWLATNCCIKILTVAIWTGELPPNRPWRYEFSDNWKWKRNFLCVSSGCCTALLLLIIQYCGQCPYNNNNNNRLVRIH